MYFRHAFFIARRIGFGFGFKHHLSVAILTSSLGLSLGVAVLILVLSVINGFQDALQMQVLRLIPHVTLHTKEVPVADGVLAKRLAAHADIAAFSPFTGGAVLISLPGRVRSARFSDLVFENSEQQSFFASRLGTASRMPQSPFEMLIGSRLAQELSVATGDSVTLTAPVPRMTLFGLFPRSKLFRVVGIFTTNTELDGRTVFASSGDVRLLLAGGATTQGWKLRLHDLFQAQKVADDFLHSPPDALSGVAHWMRSHGSLYEAIRVQKTIMWLLLSLVIAVAAFNLVSNLGALVTRKRADIAVLMSLGASRSQILAIFRWLALLVSLFGIGFGLFIGVGLSFVLTDLYLWFEAASGARLLDQYFIHYLPVRVLLTDVLFIALLALVLSVLAAVLPAKNAAQVQPAEVLRNE